MALNFEAISKNAQSIVRGEAPGSAKFLAAALLMLSIWVGVYLVHGRTVQSQTQLNTQLGRWRTLLMLSNEYKSLSPEQRKNSNKNSNVDVPAVFASVSEKMQLGSRVNRITPDGVNQSVEINRLYAEEFAELQKQLASRGVRFIAAELRALPAGSERLFTISAIIGPVN